MKFIDWFCGIGGFRLGLERHGFTHAASCELAEFPRRVYAEQFGAAPTWKDVRDVRVADLPRADLWCGGFPCQDVSLAGTRLGLLGGKRSSLVFRLLGLAAAARPRWLLLENTPGLLVRGQGFDRLLGVLSRLGYGWAYRVLDARYAGVAQRRERVYLLACRDPGAGRERAAQALLESEGLRWDPPESGGEGAQVSYTLTTRPGSRRDASDTYVWSEKVAEPLTAHESRNYCHAGNNPRPRNVVAGGTVVSLFDGAQITSPHNRSTCKPGAPAYTLTACRRPHIAELDGAWVRTLIPTEWERLQGFPDGFTAIKGASDEARGKALGNAVAVPVVAWIAKRLMAANLSA